MNQTEFKKLPELLTRKQVIQCGIADKAIAVLRVRIVEADQKVDFGKIGAVQLPGRHCKDPSKAKFKYRKTDIGRILNYKLD